MRFQTFSVLTNALFLTGVTLFLGMALGNIKRLGRMRLGTGGPLFLGIPVGWAVTRYAMSVPEGSALYDSASSFLRRNAIPSEMTNMMLMLFVAAVGLLAFGDLDIVLKKYGVRFVLLGLVITFAGAGLSYVTTLLRPETNAYEASGIYTGALTSSPGLGAAMEAAAKHAASAAESAGLGAEGISLMVNEAGVRVGTGYAVSYPFGMIVVILSMTLLPRIFKIDLSASLEEYRAEVAEMRKMTGVKHIAPIPFDIKSFALVCAAGYLLGSVEIAMGPLGYFSLGSTGGVLIASIIMGYIGRISVFTFRMDGKHLGIIKDLSLSCYVGMVGVNYGYKVIQAFVGSGVYFVAASTCISLFCVLLGYFLGRYVLRINYIMLSGAICGGMTSTPGLGMAVDVVGTDEPAAGYAAAYPSALIGMVIFTLVMFNL